LSTFASAVASITDPYERQARLFPALLALLPLFITIGLIYGPKVSALTNLMTVVVACGGLYLLAQISRDRGKALEDKLFAEWGGKPSTQLLRHRDPLIEAATKARYHAFLSRKLDQALPDSTQEANDPKAADDLYQSAVRWLLNHTADHERFHLLFKENISYGFRRNALGLKPIALPIAVACVAFVLVKYGVLTSSGRSSASLGNLPDEAWIPVVVSLVGIGLWIAFFTKKGVRIAAFTYAETLLRACDVLA
jgi:hypothetical protein